MSTISKERAQEIFLGNGPEPTASEERELARIALASLEAKPIGAFHIADQQVGGTTDYIKDGEWPIDDGVIEVYAAPPAPVSVPDEVTTEDCPAFVKYDFTDVDEAWARGFNACRAAMLNPGKSNG